MSTKKATKRALLTSILAICMCLVMLIGSTFAWFTDTASTGVNKIQAGNLDVQLLMKNKEGKYQDISNATTAIFGNENSLVAQNDNQNTLWEPGKTQVAYLAIKNNGNLDLKYQVQLKVTNPTDGKNLYEVMKYAIVPDAQDSVSSWDASKGLPVVAGAQVVSVANTTDPTDPAGVKLGHGETHYFALLVHMDENAGNTYMNGKVEFDLTVLAAQLNSESDSFGPDYDASAQYPDTAFVTVTAPTEEDITNGNNPLAAALTSAAEPDATTGEAKQKIAIKLEDGTYTLTDKEGESKTATAGKDIVLIGAGAENTAFSVEKTDVNGEANGTYCFDGAKSVVLKDMTIKFNSGDYRGFNRVGSIRLENCTIVGMASEWATGSVEFNNCNFVFSDDYNQWTNSLWTRTGSSFTFNRCTFTSENGKFINVYREGNPDTVVNVTLNNCEFINKTTTANKAAVNIKSQCAWNVTINNCTTEGAFPEANNGLWQSQPDFGTANAGNKVTVTS